MQEQRIRSDLIDGARAWLADCYWSNMEPEEFDDLTDAEISRAVARYFVGGIAAFVAAVEC